jgi:hypothetical protein
MNELTENSSGTLEASEEQDRSALSLFLEFLPHYCDIADDLPASIKLKLVLNGFTSIWNACTVLCDSINDRKLRKHMNSMLRHMQTWHEMPSITDMENCKTKTKRQRKSNAARTGE